MSRYDFQLEANVLSGDDGRQFRWDTHFGGEFDLFNYVKGRATVVTDYEAVLGSEFRPFDPNQGIYILEPAGSWFVGRNEVSFVFHHVSRHLSDRPKTYAIAYNAALGRYLRKFVLPNNTTVAVRASAGKITQRSQVDYTWTMDWDVDGAASDESSPRAVWTLHGRGVRRRPGGSRPRSARSTRRGSSLARASSGRRPIWNSSWAQSTGSTRRRSTSFQSRGRLPDSELSASNLGHNRVR